MNSLERSLQLGLISSLVALMFVFWWTATLSSRLLTESIVFNRLQSDAKNVVSMLDFDADPTGEPRLGHYRLNPAYNTPVSGYYFVIKLQDKEMTSRSAWEQQFDIPLLAPGQLSRRRETGKAGEPLLFWMGGFSTNGHVYTVAVAENIGPIIANLRVFQWFSGILGVVLLIALLGVQRWVIRRSVEKLDAIRLDMARLEHGQIDALSEGVPSEILPLVTEFNRLLRRFDQRLRQSRNAVGNLAHSLKGPLNLLLRASTAEQLDEKQKMAIAQNAESIRRLIESELKRARLAGRGAVGQRFDVDAELPALIGLLEQVYSDKSVDVRYNIGPDVELVHDRQDMLELIGNLLDNAVKWGRVSVMLTMRSAKGVLIEVEDDGPGCSPEQLGRLTGRGVRLDESVDGHGLGLSIVKDIVDTYEGQLELSASTRLGGLKVSVHLPASRRRLAFRQ